MDLSSESTWVLLFWLTSTGVAMSVPYGFEPPEQTAWLDCGSIQMAVELYRNIDGPKDACPTLDDLISVRKINPETERDPWGTRYVIRCTDPQTVEVVSAGRDRVFGTKDDVATDPPPKPKLKSRPRR